MFHGFVSPRDPSLSDTDIILQARQLCGNGKPQEALLILDYARRQHPNATIIIEMAKILDDMSLPEQAGTVLEQGIKQFADNPAMAIAYGNHCYRQNCPDKGLNMTSHFATVPNAAKDMLLTHAHLLKSNGQILDAEAFYKKVLINDSKNAIALSSLGGIALDQQNYTSALDYYRAAHTHAPAHTHIEIQLAYTEFRSGDFRNAWAHYGARFGNASTVGIVERRTHPYPPWDGKPLSQEKLLVWCEQAAGEELLYSTMLNDAAALCPHGLMVECDARLKPLFERSFKDITFIARGNPPDLLLNDKDITAQCAAGQLGQFFRNSLTDFPTQPARLCADKARVKMLREGYEHEKRRLGKTGRIIGISWKSKPLLQGDPKSSIFADWRTLFEQSPHLFVSLQYGDISQDVALAAQQCWPLFVDNQIDQFKSLDDFAAQTSAMDHVISVSNTTAHMAGMCGISSAILLTESRGLMWHWFDKESADSTTSITHSPWYPTLTLLRQQRDGEWQDVLLKAKQFLQ